MKDKDKRSVALQQEIAEQMRAIRPPKVDPKAGVLVLLADVRHFAQ